MQNKYVNTIFYSVIIVVIIFLGMGTMMRFKADMYFDMSRKSLYGYANYGKNEKFMQWSYNEAIKRNPLEFYNYANLLNREYLRLIAYGQN